MSKIQSESNSQRTTFAIMATPSCDRYVKDTIWKQFTTKAGNRIVTLSLWSVCQRYNLKAIHNVDGDSNVKLFVVIGMSKIQSESNSQLGKSAEEIDVSCDRYVKDTIWKQFTTVILLVLCLLQLWSVCQRYNLKAIHNNVSLPKNSILVVIGMSKIQSESNSQQ